jgi:hypothetical protein
VRSFEKINERLSLELEVKQKMVRQAELEAEADKARQVKHAEAQAPLKIICLTETIPA